MTYSGVTVSVVSHEHFDEIPQLLQDLADIAHESVNEVIITLNIPEPDLKKWVEERGWPFVVSIIDNKVPLGYGANHNQAFSRCKTDFFCVVNPDVRLFWNPFPALLASFVSDRVGCVYPMQSNRNGLPIDCSREVPSPSSLLARYTIGRLSKKLQDSHWINGAFMLFSSSVFLRIGGFDPAYYMYCEDVEICLRLKLLGFQLVPVGDAQIRHMAQHASRRRLRHLIWHLQSLWRLWHSDTYRRFVLRLRKTTQETIDQHGS